MSAFAVSATHIDLLGLPRYLDKARARLGGSIAIVPGSGFLAECIGAGDAPCEWMPEALAAPALMALQAALLGTQEVAARGEEG